MQKRQLRSTKTIIRLIVFLSALIGTFLIYKFKFSDNNSYCNSSKECYDLLKSKAQHFQQHSGLNDYFAKAYQEEGGREEWKELSDAIAETDDEDEELSPEELEYQRLTDTSLPRVKAAFVVLARNSELYALRSSMRYLEERFNHKYNYPWIFLNEQPFTEEFKNLTARMTSAKVHYGLVPKEHWSYPDWIDQEHAAECRQELEDRGIIYGGSESYRHMCRYQSGFFMLHPLLDNLDYYWRVEPGVKFSCDIDYDPFRLMQERNLKYGFTVALREYFETIPTLWEATRKYVQTYPQYIYPRTRKDSLLGLISDDSGWSYNLCHFWSNFEIASVKFMRSEGYQSYFRFLDQAGGFFYERWGDAPVHSIAVALMLKRSDVHWFYDIGYKHDFFEHCPTEEKWFLQSKCYCDPETTFDINPGSCTPRFLEVMNRTASSFIVTLPNKDDY
ncbi:hypothetical protein G6F61_010050 [Rhizopus arrhizus]|nr:hypothetical protein G6F61_010050 [Rhizopus arrhizus]